MSRTKNLWVRFTPVEHERTQTEKDAQIQALAGKLYYRCTERGSVFYHITVCNSLGNHRPHSDRGIIITV